jgi:hypothetical protein
LAAGLQIVVAGLLRIGLLDTILYLITINYVMIKMKGKEM